MGVDAVTSSRSRRLVSFGQSAFLTRTTTSSGQLILMKSRIAGGADFFTAGQCNVTSKLPQIRCCRCWFLLRKAPQHWLSNAFRWAGQPPKLSLLIGGSGLPSDTWFLGPTRTYSSIGISMVQPFCRADNIGVGTGGGAGCSGPLNF